MRNRFRSILEYILVLCIILEFNTPYLFFPFVKNGLQILLLSLLLILVLMSHYSIRKKVNGYVLIYMLGSIFPMLMLDSKFYFAYVKCFFVMLPLMWVYLSLRKSVSVSAYLSVFFKLLKYNDSFVSYIFNYVDTMFYSTSYPYDINVSL